MRKRALSLLLALAMCLTLTAPAGAYDTGKAGKGNLVSAGMYHAGFIDKDGTLWKWGKNSDGESGNGTTVTFGVPVPVLDGVTAVSCGDGYTAAIKTDRSLWTWGHDNGDGRLGNGSKGNATNSQGQTIQSVPVKVLDNVAAVNCGLYCTAAIKTDGSLWMWGWNGLGGLGNGSKGNMKDSSKDPYQTVPVKVMSGVTAVSCGREHTAAIKTDGSLWTWGMNRLGELGNGGVGNKRYRLGNNPIYQDVPVKVMDNVAAVSCGWQFTAAIKTDGTLWTWGLNSYGQLGNGGVTNAKDPYGYGLYLNVPMKVLDNVAAVSCGGNHAAAIKTDGSLWMWGSNSYGQLGNGTMKSSDVPVKVLDNVAAVSCGSRYTVIVKTDGTVWTWGENSTSYYQLGYEGGNIIRDEYESKQTVPKQVMGLSAAVFADVRLNAYYADAVAWAVDNGITNGKTPTTFAPNESCTHGQILTFLWRSLGQPWSDVEPPIAMKGDEYYYEAARWAAENDMIGADFDPNALCNRAYAVLYIWQAFGRPAPSGESPFTDVPAHWSSATAVAWAVENGVTNGATATTFNPGKICNRGEIVTFLYRYFGK